MSDAPAVRPSSGTSARAAAIPAGTATAYRCRGRPSARPAAEPWLPQPRDWASYAADRQVADPASMLTLYRTALGLRRTEPGFGDGPLTWLPSGPGVLALARGDGPVCVVNLGREPAGPPPHEAVLPASGPLTAGELPPDTAVWLRGRGVPGPVQPDGDAEAAGGGGRAGVRR